MSNLPLIWKWNTYLVTLTPWQNRNTYGMSDLILYSSFQFWIEHFCTHFSLLICVWNKFFFFFNLAERGCICMCLLQQMDLMLWLEYIYSTIWIIGPNEAWGLLFVNIMTSQFYLIITRDHYSLCCSIYESQRKSAVQKFKESHFRKAEDIFNTKSNNLLQNDTHTYRFKYF